MVEYGRLLRLAYYISLDQVHRLLDKRWFNFLVLLKSKIEFKNNEKGNFTLGNYTDELKKIGSINMNCLSI